ncbi:hypothetical protein WOLCODRAFT_144398 [Wolfiporia cocos MD-104 SS10]|uniref:MATH domain-containing protein n=1 Tax=Wolfiporia cocos (strain MD-104) TaxID=742152 RepID=A0A2H3JNS5_WOLCO|nr:hypothetical protein WOLCODRAFT_144398 [Wolfiporia cocos MD-104 SS10]
MPIPLQHHDYRVFVTASFLLDNLKEFFELESSQGGTSSKRRYTTDSFGPCWNIAYEGFRPREDDDSYVSIWFDAAGTPSAPLYCSITAESRDGTRHFNRTFTWPFPPGQRRYGWKKALSRSKLWDQNDTLQQENALLVTVTVQSPPEGPDTHTKETLSLLHRTITGNDSESRMVFTTFTRRSSSGILSNECTLFADNDIMKKFCDRWNNRQSVRPVIFARVPNLLHTASVVRIVEEGADEVINCDTDYADDDSDFDEDLTEDDINVDSHTPQNMRAKAEECAHSTVSTAEDISSTTDESEIETLEASSAASQGSESATGSDLNSVSGHPSLTQIEVACQPVPHIRAPRIVVVGAASTTWEALLFYLHSGTITFAPLTSGGACVRRAFIKNHKRTRPHLPAPCSCKSMYRLANELRLHRLKKLAMDHLRSQLSRRTILAEIFSQFTSRFEEVKNIELEVLRSHWSELVGTPGLREMLARVVRGDYPHAKEVMADMMQYLTGNASGA